VEKQRDKGREMQAKRVHKKKMDAGDEDERTMGKKREPKEVGTGFESVIYEC
jgi:hypothetical protein